MTTERLMNVMYVLIIVFAVVALFSHNPVWWSVVAFCLIVVIGRFIHDSAMESDHLLKINCTRAQFLDKEYFDNILALTKELRKNGDGKVPLYITEAVVAPGALDYAAAKGLEVHIDRVHTIEKSKIQWRLRGE